MSKPNRPERIQAKVTPGNKELTPLVQATLNEWKKGYESESRQIGKSSSSRSVVSRMKLQYINNLIKTSTTSKSAASKQMLNLVEAFSNVLEQRKNK